MIIDPFMVYTSYTGYTMLYRLLSHLWLKLVLGFICTETGKGRQLCGDWGAPENFGQTQTGVFSVPWLYQVTGHVMLLYMNSLYNIYILIYIMVYIGLNVYIYIIIYVYTGLYWQLMGRESSRVRYFIGYTIESHGWLDIVESYLKKKNVWKYWSQPEIIVIPCSGLHIVIGRSHFQIIDSFIHIYIYIYI